MARLLQRQGYAATGLNQVVAEAKAPKGSMYFHFPGGKEELAAEAVAGSGAFIAAVLADQLARKQSTVRAIERFIDVMAEQLQRTAFHEGCPIATVALEAAPTSEAIGAATSDAFASWIDLLASRFEQDGLKPAAARSRATLVIAALEGALVLSKASRTTEPLRTIRTHLPRLCR